MVIENYITELYEENKNRIPWIFCVLAGGSQKLKLRAAKELYGILNKMDIQAICQADEQMRRTTSMEWSIEWHNLKVQDFLTDRMSYEEKRAVIIFSSFSPNGYIREQAVSLLSSFKGTLPYIALRENDWVSQVRTAAHLSYCARIGTAGINELLQTLPVLAKLKRSSRVSYTEVIKPFSKKLADPDGREIIRNGLKVKEAGVRRFCLDMLFDLQPPDYAMIEGELMFEKDPYLRRIIFHKFMEAGYHSHETGKLFLKDKHPGNRVIALQYFNDSENDETALKEAIAMIMDRNARVRELARKIIRKLSPCMDIHKIYLDHLLTDPQAAILGLGETGEAEDCVLIEPYLYSEIVSETRAAMSALANLNITKYQSAITNMLLSEYAGIVKTAKILIIKYAIQDFDLIWDIYQRTACENTKIKCAALLFSASKWERLLFMLRVNQCEYESVRNFASCAICRWFRTFNRSFRQIRAEERQLIIELANKQEEQLGEDAVKQIIFLSR